MKDSTLNAIKNLMSLGLGARKIADRLKMPYGTINYHVNQLRKHGNK